MGLQSGLFSPAKYGIIPELVPHSRLSAANGALEMFTFLAIVGGTRFGRGDGASEFIRATQAVRQPGSSFKPIIYAAAIDEGWSK